MVNLTVKTLATIVRGLDVLTDVEGRAADPERADRAARFRAEILEHAALGWEGLDPTGPAWKGPAGSLRDFAAAIVVDLDTAAAEGHADGGPAYSRHYLPADARDAIRFAQDPDTARD